MDERDVIPSEIGNAKQITSIESNMVRSTLLSELSLINNAEPFFSESAESILADAYKEENYSNSSDIRNSIMLIPSMLALHAWRKQRAALEKIMKAECSIAIEYRERVLCLEKQLHDVRLSFLMMQNELNAALMCIKNIEKCIEGMSNILEREAEEKKELEMKLELNKENCKLTFSLLAQQRKELLACERINEQLEIYLQAERCKNRKLEIELNVLNNYKIEIESTKKYKAPEQNSNNINAQKELITDTDLGIVVPASSQNNFCKYIAKTIRSHFSNTKLKEVMNFFIYVAFPVAGSPITLAEPFPILCCRLYFEVCCWLKERRKNRNRNNT